MNEIIFLVQEAFEGGYSACALGHPIFTEADSPGELRQQVLDAVALHFGPGQGPAIIRLRFVRENVISA